jgi:hypothetical protein
MFVMTRKRPSGAECRKDKDREVKLEEEEVFRLSQERKKEEEENRSPFTIHRLR